MKLEHIWINTVLTNFGPVNMIFVKLTPPPPMHHAMHHAIYPNPAQPNIAPSATHYTAAIAITMFLTDKWSEYDKRKSVLAKLKIAHNQKLEAHYH